MDAGGLALPNLPEISRFTFLQLADPGHGLSTSCDVSRTRPVGGKLDQHGTESVPASVGKDSRVSVLWLPDPPAPDLLPAFADLITSRDARPDAIVIGDASAQSLLTSWVSKGAAAVVPIIDASGQSIAGVDLTIPIASPQSLALALRALQPVMDRVRSLPGSFFQSTDPGLWLLARLATRQRAAEPVRDVTSRSTIRFADEAVLPDLFPCAEHLSRSGHLDRHFFDRLDVCAACSSARLLIREECRSCRSSDVVEEPIIHHLRCAYEGPERDFRDGQYLTCPKCRNRLEHFSVDYDKPGTLTVCNTCGHTTGDAAIGYVCLDCASKADASLLRTRVVHSYTLTERGRQAVFSPILPMGNGGEMEAQQLRRWVRLFVAEHRALGIPCAILVIRLDSKKAETAGIGEDAIATAADFFGEMLRETFTPETEILRAGFTFTVLISGDSPQTIEAGLEQIRESLERHLSVDLDPSYEVMAAEDFELST